MVLLLAYIFVHNRLNNCNRPNSFLIGLRKSTLKNLQKVQNTLAENVGNTLIYLGLHHCIVMSYSAEDRSQVLTSVFKIDINLRTRAVFDLSKFLV